MRIMLALLAPLAVSTALAAPGPSPAPVTVTNSVNNPVPTKATDNPALQPFQASIIILIADGASGGGDNGNVLASQTLLIPTGKRLVVQTVSMYREGAISASSTQIFISVNSNGSYSTFALPPAPPSAASFSGATLTGLFYAEGGTELLADAWRNTTSGTEKDVVAVSGYLVNVP
jgi:hypothetical protein